MAYLIIYLILEPVKRVASALLYPLVYALRYRIRYQSITPIDWSPLIRCPLHWYWWPLWLMLDDSIFIEQVREYDDKEKRYPALLWKHRTDFLLSYWWSAIRNSWVNLGNYQAFKTGKMVDEELHEGRNFLIERTFTSGAKRLYAEFYILGRWNQVGWISGGRFEIDILKVRN